MRMFNGLLVLILGGLWLVPLGGVCLADEPVEGAAKQAEAAGAGAATPSGPTDPKELEAFVDGIMAATMDDKHIAGATFVFVKDNKPFFAKGYGYADVAARKPVDAATTMFRIGSVSKLFTWTAVMQLVEQGKLDLDADINTYLKDFQIPATYSDPVTLRHLLTHTPGFEDRSVGLFAHGPTDEPLGKLLAAEIPARVRKPGELASYSNHGTAIAGYIVQEVSGMPWADYIELNILEPLGMVYTTVRQPAEDQLPPEMSKGYKYERGKYVAQGFEYVPLAPAGSISASAGDMARFMIAHLQNGAFESTRILEEDSARKMRTLLFTHDPRIEGLAYGFMRMKFGNEEIVEHGGDTFAFHSFFVMLPERNSGFFVSYNTTTAGAARNTLLEALMKRYYPAPETSVPAIAKDFRERAVRYAGQYGATRNSWSTLTKIGALFSVANVSLDDDQLVLSTAQADSTLRFVEVEPGVFREVDGERMLVFRQEGDSPAAQLYVSGAPLAFVRLPWYDTPGFNAWLIAGCVAVFLSAVVGWPLAAFIARGGNRTEKRSGGSRLASWLGWTTSLVILVVLGLAMIPFSDPQQIAFGVPALLRGLLWSNLLVVALVVALLACTIAAWANGYWRLSGRLHYTCVLAAGVALVWFLYHWNLLGVAA